MPIKCMLSPQPATGGEERERHRPNQVDALTTHQLQVERRERHRANQVDALTTHQLQVERRERHRANQVDALTTHQLQVERGERHRSNQVDALTTHQLQVERRKSDRANRVSKWGLLGGHDLQGPVVVIWTGHRGYPPTLYEKSHGIFLMDHRESGPWFNVSSERRYNTLPVSLLRHKFVTSLRPKHWRYQKSLLQFNILSVVRSC